MPLIPGWTDNMLIVSLLLELVWLNRGFSVTDSDVLSELEEKGGGGVFVDKAVSNTCPCDKLPFFISWINVDLVI